MIRHITMVGALLALGGPLAGQGVVGGYAAWEAEELSAGRAARPIVLSIPRVTVTILPPGALSRVASEASLRASAGTCAQFLALDSAGITGIALGRPWGALDETIAGQPVVTFSVTPVAARPALCAPEGELRDAAVANGFLYLADTVMNLAPRVARVELRVNDEVVAPLAQGSAGVLAVAPGVQTRLADSQRRLHLAPDLFAIGPTGAVPRIELLVWVGEDRVPTTTVLSTEVINQVLAPTLRWRAARLSSAGAPRVSPVSLPVPRDRVLQRARASYRAGNPATASLEALARLASEPSLAHADSLAAQMQLALTWAQAGDAPAARTMFAEAHRTEACLFLPATSPAVARELMEAVRPAQACSPQSTVLELKRSLIPGGAQREGDGMRRRAGQVVFGLVVAQAAVAVGTGLMARSLYNQYSTEVADPSGVWSRAESARGVANAAIAGAAITWGLSALEAAYRVGRRNRALANRRDYGAKRTSTFGRVDGPEVVR